MFIIETYFLAVVLSVITMICWGSWPNTQKLVSPSWRFELFYWDYVLGILLIALVFAFTLGSQGNAGRSFIQDLLQAEWNNINSAIIGGAIFNAANILFVAALSLAGMAVAFPVGAGLGLILGVFVNFIANPVDNILFLFGGVALIALAIFLSASAYRRLSTQQGKVSAKGIVLSMIAGVLFGFFYRFIANAMYPDFNIPEPGKMGPYGAVVCFALGVLLSNFLFNTLLMKKPIEGKPLSFKDYFSGTRKDHIMGVLGGVIWGTGLILSILSAGKAGFAVSFGLGQGNAMIAAIWGVFVWKEFRAAPAGTSRFLNGMFFCYILGLACIVLAKA